MNTCRLCKKSDEPLFKYSTRHYAHAQCGFEKWGEVFLKMIAPHRVGCLPFRAVKKAGLEKQVREMLKDIDLAAGIDRRFQIGMPTQ